MTIRPVDFNGMIQRTDDVAYLKHQEDAKPMQSQQNIQIQVDQREDTLAHQVSDTNETDKTKSETDTENGGGQYSGDGGRFRKKKSKVKENGKGIQKNTASSFDIKI